MTGMIWPRPGASRLCLVVAASLTLSACKDQYLDRRDGVTHFAGEASAHNRVVQTLNPFPRGAHRRRLPTDGERVRHAIDAYREKPPKPVLLEPPPVAPSLSR
ncbi:MAG: hypothetical protein AAFQ44_01540 [Pseudomonadota bacterium]